MALTRRRVMEWLDRLDPEVVCGTAGEPNCCPLANFLSWDGAPAPYVGLNNYCRNRNDPLREGKLMPSWAAAARAAVDERISGGILSHSVRAWQFRQIMEKVL